MQKRHNMKQSFFTLFILASAISAFAQDDLFGPGDNGKKHSAFIINVNGGVDMPALDMAKRFGLSYRFGPALTYKTEKNWIFGVKYDFLVGNKIKEDSFIVNIKDKYSGSFNGKVFQALNGSGQRVGIPVYERGYMWGVQVGKIVAVKKGERDNGIMFLTTLGMMQHWINIYNRDKDVPELQGDYIKGYDRKTGGWFIDEYVGYAYFAKNKFLNFNIGIDIAWGFTQGQRAYLFDVGRADDKKRNDVLLGLRAGWMLPVFKRRSEDISFE